MADALPDAVPKGKIAPTNEMGIIRLLSECVNHSNIETQNMEWSENIA